MTTALLDARRGWEGVARDVRYAARQLRRSPGFAFTAIVTLALSIGANIVVFSVLNAVLLHPLEVSRPQDLYQVRYKQWMMGRLLTTSYPAFEDFQRRNTTFAGLAAIYGYSHASLRWGNVSASLSGDEVSGNYFDLLGVQPEEGRFFHAVDEHGPVSAPYVVLSDALWRTTFHADANVVGTTVVLNKYSFTVVGVASAVFHGTEKFRWPDYWLPMVNQRQVDGFDSLQSRTAMTATVIGRLKCGVTPQQATDDLNAIAAELARENPETDNGGALRLIHPGLIGDEGDVIRGFLWGVTLLALLVLAAACANLASLFAARAADRGRELATRVALGSSRGRLTQQVFTEALLICLIGGAAGLACGYLVLRLLNRSAPFAGALSVPVDGRVCAVGLILAVGSALLLGMLPMRQAWQSSPLKVMKGGAGEIGWSAVAGMRRFAARDLLLGVQITICSLLVTASLAAVRSMERELHEPLGFLPQGAMLADMDLHEASQSGVAADEERKILIEAARGIPGVTAVGAVNRVPMTGGLHGTPVYGRGTTEFKLQNAALSPYVFTMSPGYLEAADTELLSGRDVSWNDTTKTPYVAVVNQSFVRQANARRLWGDTEAAPIGQRFILQGNLTEVVGVVEDGKYHDLQESPQPVVYLPMAQGDDDETVLVVRSHRLPQEMAATLSHTLSSIAPNAPFSIQSWTDLVANELFPARAAALALGAMGMLAAMLAVTGIFGMAAYSVSQRMKELGIRVALGARRPHLMIAAVGRPIAMLVIGSLAGLMCGLFSTGLLGRLVYQANTRDPVVLSAVVGTMALLGFLAMCLPMRRALRVNPASLMRED